MGILNFTFSDSGKSDFKHEIKLLDTETYEVFYDKLTFIYLEMPKFNKREDQLVTMFDKWLFVLKNLSSLFERPAALQERIFNRLFEAAEIARFSPSELSNYEESLKNFRDMYSVITTAEKKGHAEGLAEGLEKGLAEGAARKAMEIATSLKAAGLPVSEIAKLTGLAPEQLQSL